MSTFIPSAPGEVQRVLTGRRSIPFRVNIPGFFRESAIVTHAAIKQQGNFQFLHTIEDFIYVYVFGDRVGELVVSGVAFLSNCEGGGGVESTFNYYTRNRIARKGKPVRLAIGNIPLEAFLIGQNIEVKDTGPGGSLGFFTMNFAVFPEDTGRGGTNFFNPFTN